MLMLAKQCYELRHFASALLLSQTQAQTQTRMGLSVTGIESEGVWRRRRLLRRLTLLGIPEQIKSHRITILSQSTYQIKLSSTLRISSIPPLHAPSASLGS